MSLLYSIEEKIEDDTFRVLTMYCNSSIPQKYPLPWSVSPLWKSVPPLKCPSLFSVRNSSDKGEKWVVSRAPGLCLSAGVGNENIQ